MSSEREEIEGKLREFVTAELLGGEDDDELTATTNLLALGIIDSISMVSLRVFIERTFEIRLPDGVQPEEFGTLASMTEMIERVQQGKS